jgi:hypothetical protein
MQDVEIAAFEKVAFASYLVDESALDAPILVSDCRKNGASYRVSATH